MNYVKPIPVSAFSQHVMRMQLDENQGFKSEYNVRIYCVLQWVYVSKQKVRKGWPVFSTSVHVCLHNYVNVHVYYRALLFIGVNTPSACLTSFYGDPICSVLYPYAWRIYALTGFTKFYICLKYNINFYGVVRKISI